MCQNCTVVLLICFFAVSKGCTSLSPPSYSVSRYMPFLINELICLCDQYRLCEKVQFSYPLCAFFTLKSCHALVNTLCLYINKTAYNMVYTKYPIMVYTKNLSSWLGYFVYTQPL